MKSLVLVFGILIAFIAVPAIQGVNVLPNKVWGSRGPSDERLLYKIVQQKGSMFAFSKKVEDVDYPGKGAFSTNNITYIECINQTPNVASTVEILKGGIGFPFVRLHFKAPRFHGYNYILQIYGKPATVYHPAPPQQPIPPVYHPGYNPPPPPGYHPYPPPPYNNNVRHY